MAGWGSSQEAGHRGERVLQGCSPGQVKDNAPVPVERWRAVELPAERLPGLGRVLVPDRREQHRHQHLAVLASVGERRRGVHRRDLPQRPERPVDRRRGRQIRQHLRGRSVGRSKPQPWDILSWGQEGGGRQSIHRPESEGRWTH
eukprot:SAG22_NODE_3830_length_1512_cov_75.643312_3_plen_144_part_01